MTSPPILFSHQRLDAIEKRARKINAKDADFIYKEAARTIAERLEVTNREFPIAVDYLSPFNAMTSQLIQSKKIKQLYHVSSLSHQDNAPSTSEISQIYTQKETLPFEKNSLNLITSVMKLQRINDLPGLLVQFKQALIDDGLLIGCLPGENTLKELRQSLLQADSEINEAASLRVDPFIDIRQMGGLLQRAGFALPVVDRDVLSVNYSSFSRLISDLRAMGAASANVTKPEKFSRKLFKRAEEIYHEKFSNDAGKLIASVELVYFSGWKPHPSQQKALPPGSAKLQLKDFLQTD